MVTQITAGVKVSVRTAYQPSYSSPAQSHYVFTYEVIIENQSEFTVQLLRREWQIFDSDGQIRLVEGEGVVGQQPILEPGASHKYISGCNLKTNIGKMKGNYLMEKVVDGSIFQAQIPEFVLIPNYKLN